MTTSPAPRLILVEGMPGAGKTTTAKQLAEWLPQQGIPARCYPEMADDNPIRTPGVDAMRANHPQVRPLPDTGADGFAKDPAVYAIEQWGGLAARARDGAEVLILESRYIQNSALPGYLAGGPRDDAFAIFRAITSQLADAPALLIYLRPLDARAHVQRTLDARAGVWSEWVVRAFARAGWAKARELTGPEAMLAFYEDWEAITAELCQLHQGPSLVLSDPQLDWTATHDRIHAALGG